MEQFRGIPYGISNFKQLKRENLYYVDKSQYISKLEQTGHLIQKNTSAPHRSADSRPQIGKNGRNILILMIWNTK